MYKSTIVIWSEHNPQERELDDLAREAVSGDSYCSKFHVESVDHPKNDPDWDGTEFFDTGDIEQE
jgi:hypothetical protein